MSTDMEGGKKSAWMSHVKKTMKAHKGMKLGQVLKMASKTFKKGGKKGGAALTPAHADGGDGGDGPAGTAPVSGGRRRKTAKKSRKGRKGGKH